MPRKGRRSKLGDEAVELAKTANLNLDPWEEMVLRRSLGQERDGTWTAFEVGVVVSRQNGKGAILEARELAGLFLIEERLIVHSAHQFDTSLEAFRRLLDRIEDTPELDQQVKRLSRSHGEEGIELTGGRRIRFRTRTKGGGRGFSCDCLVLDEAMILPEMSHGALLPTLSARPNPQVWYAGSAVDQWIHEHGLVLARLRERGLAGDDPSLAYFEWSLDAASPEWVEEKTADDRKAWAKANPALGIRISEEHIANERRSMDPRTFAVERLGVGDWPETNSDANQVIDPLIWRNCADVDSQPSESLVIAFDVTPDRSRASIGVASPRGDEKLHVEVIEHGEGTKWLPPRLAELKEKHQPKAILCDKASPAASLLPELEELNLDVEPITATEHAQACGAFYDAAEQDKLRHLDQADLNAAVKGAQTRSLGESWAWSRKNSAVDISPLVACTMAAWGALTKYDHVPMVAWR